MSGDGSFENSKITVKKRATEHFSVAYQTTPYQEKKTEFVLITDYNSTLLADGYYLVASFS